MARTKSVVAAALFTVALIGVSASPALAGEVKGPPGIPNNTNETGALDHANSACAASGLNDFDTTAGQTVSQVQTAADSWSTTACPRVRQARSVSAGAGPARGETQWLAPALSRGRPSLCLHLHGRSESPNERLRPSVPARVSAHIYPRSAAGTAARLRCVDARGYADHGGALGRARR